MPNPTSVLSVVSRLNQGLSLQTSAASIAALSAVNGQKDPKVPVSFVSLG